MKFWRLLITEFRLHMYMTNQYRFESVLFIFIYSAVFAGLFYGAKSFLPGDMSSDATLDKLMFGYFMYIYAMLTFNAAPHGVVEDTNRGYIDQLIMAPQGFLKLLTARVLVKVAWSVVQLTVLVYVAMFITGNWIDFNFLAFYGLLLLATPSLIGIGFINCGLAHVFKKINIVNGLVTMSLMFLVAIDAYPVNVASALPFILGASIARDVVLEGASIPIADIALIVLNSAVYLGIGVYLYGLFERRAKRLNMIGVY
jgi:ABC-2 type transport system permease protein